MAIIYEECVLDSYIECNGHQYPCSSDRWKCYQRFSCDYVKCSSSTKSQTETVGPSEAVLIAVIIPVALLVLAVIISVTLIICMAKKRLQRSRLQNSQVGGPNSAFVIGPPSYDASARAFTNLAMNSSEIIPSAPPTYEEACIKYESDPAPPYQLPGTSNN